MFSPNIVRISSIINFVIPRLSNPTTFAITIHLPIPFTRQVFHLFPFNTILQSNIQWILLFLCLNPLSLIGSWFFISISSLDSFLLYKLFIFCFHFYFLQISRVWSLGFLFQLLDPCKSLEFVFWGEMIIWSYV